MSKNKIPVYLNVYDFTSINSCLDIFGIGGYHTGIQLKNLQFCYFVCQTQKTKTGVVIIEPQSADFNFKCKIYLGETLLDGQEMQKIIDQLSLKFTNGSYHMFKYNCNHFSDELARKLVGKSIPSWIFRSTNILRFMCCCLPTGLVSGQWVLQMLQEQIKKQQQKNKRKISQYTTYENEKQNQY